MSHFIFYYRSLRLKMLYRLLRQIGFLRSCFLLGIAYVVMYFLYKIDNQYAVSGVFLVLALSLNQYRRDRQFLQLLISRPSLLLMIEYLLLSVPFVVVSSLKGEWIQVGAMLLAVVLVPFCKKIHSEYHMTVPLPFMYRGGIDMLYSMRMVGWILPVLIAGGVMGCCYDNVKIVRVCTALYMIILSISMCNPQSLVQHFSSFRQFLVMNFKMVGYNLPLLVLPMCILLIYSENTVSMPLCLLLGGFLFALASLFVRYVISNSLFMFIHIALSVALYVTTVMSVWGGILFAIVIAIYLFGIKIKYNYLWKY